jgi:hypothetical protein
MALGTVAQVLAAADPDRAERIANTITDAHRKAIALVEIANTLAPKLTTQSEIARYGTFAGRSVKPSPWRFQ